MEIFNVGGPELLLLVFLAGVLLGPRRMVLMARELGNIMRQIKLVSRSLTKELNREIDLLDREMRLDQPQHQADEPITPDAEIKTPSPALDQVEAPEAEEAALEESPVNDHPATQPTNTGESRKLPDAYQRFIEDFPEDALEELQGSPPVTVNSD
jgi:Sec-independent protein translocase protein TatA